MCSWPILLCVIAVGFVLGALWHRAHAADADLDRAIRHLKEAKEFDANGRRTYALAARLHACELIERHLDFIQIDPEAKL